MFTPEHVLCALEAHKSGCLHAHALWGTSAGTPSYRELNRWWFKREGIARFYPYDPRLGAAYYVTKYLFKDQWSDSHWFIWTEDERAA